MPKYKFIFSDAVLQNRQFISLTKTTDDGRSFILHWVGAYLTMDRQCNYLMSFGSYAPKVANKELEFTIEQISYSLNDIDEPHANEEAYYSLLKENIIEKLFSDKAFLNVIERDAKKGDDEVSINTEKELRQVKYPDKVSKGYQDGSLIQRYRNNMVKLYFNYLLGCNNLSVNAHPEGLYTVIQAGRTDRIDNAGVNDLHIDPNVIPAIQNKMKSLIKSEICQYPIIFQYRFMGEPVPHVSAGRGLEIDEPTSDQIKTVDHLFNLAAQNNLFPPDPKAMLCQAWTANCEKIARANQGSYWKPGSPALLSSPLQPVQSNNDQAESESNFFDIGFNVRNTF